MKLINDYVGRAAYFMRQGKSKKDVLLLEPLGSVWARWVPGGLSAIELIYSRERWVSGFRTFRLRNAELAGVAFRIPHSTRRLLGELPALAVLTPDIAVRFRRIRTA